jgi:hypothetical protein
VVSFTLRSLHTRGKRRYPFDKRLGLDNVERRKFLPLTGTKIPTYRPFSPLPVAIPTVLSRLRRAGLTVANVLPSRKEVNTVFFKYVLISLNV